MMPFRNLIFYPSSSLAFLCDAPPLGDRLAARSNRCTCSSQKPQQKVQDASESNHKILELNLFGSDWPGQGTLLISEPITVA